MSRSPQEREVRAQLQKISALLDELGVPKAVVFKEEPNKNRTDLPARVEWALLAASTATPTEPGEQDATIKAMADYIRTRAGHEEHCRGWRQRRSGRGESMDISQCTCGPGELLRKAKVIP